MNKPCYFISSRRSTLWVVTIIALLPVIITSYLVSRMPAVGEGSEFSEPLHLNLFRAGMVLFSGVLFYPVCWLSGRYVLSIHRNEEVLEVKIWSLLGTRHHRIPLSSTTTETSVQYHEGSLQIPMKPWVMAPWYSVRLKGWRKWVIDAQGDFPYGEDELRDLLKGLV